MHNRCRNEDIPFNHKLKIELDLQSLFGLLCITTETPPPSRIWAQIRGRYWSAKIDDISL
jgi:hypothetical protein